MVAVVAFLEWSYCGMKEEPTKGRRNAMEQVECEGMVKSGWQEEWKVKERCEEKE